ncbi:ATP-dependent DNA helicase DinG [Plasticicumulans lactativorans]|uniref:ATP-dependent DNA helicase DinG n=1 Tax=Plasticicumulans lactativorans TaxID=1133106 RepID=A0A4R2L6G5_9GAMM|nr:ATP-dependent DNA helicase [Plasticicumulans lactativorans]TCO82424.1 ATP-dependent DNA helicase DinG [Plasticicumulans lactativorans]
MDIDAAFGADGPLARSLPGFAPRAAQVTMARAVAAALESGGVLIAEAGTGTGKTFAYLVPALLSGLKVIVSTGTRNLQDQLFHKDLPVVRAALGRGVKVALLKGRANYLCRQRLEGFSGAGRLRSRAQAHEYTRVQAWAARTRSGDIAELADVAEDSPLWPQVTSTADNCLGAECPVYQDCFVVQARREAQEADLLVINHHLFFADMAIKEEGFAELLPGADAFVLDEAHQLPEVAGQFFGVSLSSRQLVELARDAGVEQLRDAPEFRELGERAGGLDKAVADLRLAFGTELRRAPWNEVAALPALVDGIAALQAALAALTEALRLAAPRGKGLENCLERAGTLAARVEQLTQPAAGEVVHWFETHVRSFTIAQTPLEIAPLFRGRMERYHSAWIFTSATLAVADGFTHFAHRLGLPAEAATLRLDSPFDFARNALLYHPPDLPDPASPRYTQALVEAIVPVLAASRGRAFLLFTSFRALNEAAERLAGRVPWPLLIQGSLPKAALLARFRELGDAVLLGTASFWEGVDVRGEALSCVIIDKLPFASPGDPVLAARIEAMKRAGGNPFIEYQLPHAVITLKQGVGRLIRDVSDRGVLVLADPRLLTKPYGRLFLDSLPPMTRTRQIERVQRFFAWVDAGAADA